MVLKEVIDCAMFCTMWVVLEGFLSQCAWYWNGTVLHTVLGWYLVQYLNGTVPCAVLARYLVQYWDGTVLHTVLLADLAGSRRHLKVHP